MPQGPAHLHEKWGDLGNALVYLRERGFTERLGIIRPPDGHTPTREESSAIDYLFLEWDFGYAP